MKKKLIIIGAGLSGLISGIYAQLSGFETEIMEKNNKPGGLCAIQNDDNSVTNFYPLIHGVSPYSSFYQVWKELDVLNELKLIDLKEYKAIYTEDGQIFHAYADLKKLEQEMISLSKADEPLIRLLIDDIRKISRLDLPINLSSRKIKDYFVLRSYINKYKMSAWKFAMQFSSNQLADYFTKAFNIHDQSLFITLMDLASINNNNAKIPLEGSIRLIESLEKKFRQLGGIIRLNAEVSKIIIKKNRAVGISLNNREDIFADAIISCADGHTTLYEWIGEKYLSFGIKEIYKKLECFPPICYLSLLINENYPEVPDRFILSYPQGVKIEFSYLNHLCVEKVNSFFHIMIPTIWKNWDLPVLDYKDQKEKIRNNVIKALELKFPGLNEKIISSNLLTPVSMNRYSGIWKGSYQGFLLKEKNRFMQLPQKLPLLNRFYMAGQWTNIPGDITSSAFTSRNAIKKLCHEMRIPFNRYKKI